MNFNRIGKLNDLLTYDLKRKPTIMLEPNPEHSYRVSGTANDIMLGIDTEEWEIPDELKPFVEELAKSDISNEEKILKIYQRLCEDYTYDDNVLSYIRKNDDESFFLPDEYGRKTNPEWKENRKKHNRRVCYEFARLYAKAINELLRDNHNLEAVMVGDKENLHYVVGLTGNDYSVILDLDNFNKIKDLTRLKLGLTINGITILRDDFGKFQKALDNFNKDRLDELAEVKEIEEKFKGKDDIKYFKSVIDILKKYNIDSQGFFEYMRAKIEQEKIKIEKIWKEVKGSSERRYLRCLIFSFNYKTYLLDSDEKTLSEVDKEKLDKKVFIFNPEENEYPYYGG